jgi:tRNA G26 N,N-dimethylase Trm1
MTTTTFKEEQELASKLRLAVKQVHEFKSKLLELGYNVVISEPDTTLRFAQEVIITKTQEVKL